MIKDNLEWTANYFNLYHYEPGGVTVNSAVRDYNYDLWSGIEYTRDVTKPVGRRVVELKLNGEPLATDRVVRVALNNYLATGKFPTAPKLYQSTVEVCELITNWIVERKVISPEDVFVQNFTLLPPVNTWLSSSAGSPVTNADYADLLWTAFGGAAEDYLSFPGYPGVLGGDLNRQESLFILVNNAMLAPQLKEVDRSVLKLFSDAHRVLAWMKDALVYTIHVGVFMPVDNLLLPEQLATNAEVLAWVRAVIYPTP